MKTLIQPVPATLDFAKSLFTRGTDAFGPDEISQAFNLGPGVIPEIPFTETELERARELNQYLILQADIFISGMICTMHTMREWFHNKLGKGILLYGTEWYKKEEFYTKDTPRLGWALVSREVIPGSTSINYFDQTQVLSDYLVKQVYKGEELPDHYQTAVKEFADRKSELENLLSKDWKKCAEQLAELKLNQLFRERPVEVLYGITVQHENNHEYLLQGMYTWTSVRSSGGRLARVGNFGPGGVGVDSDKPGHSASSLGVRFFRSGADLEH